MAGVVLGLVVVAPEGFKVFVLGRVASSLKKDAPRDEWKRVKPNRIGRPKRKNVESVYVQGPDGREQ